MWRLSGRGTQQRVDLSSDMHPGTVRRQGGSPPSCPTKSQPPSRRGQVHHLMGRRRSRQSAPSEGCRYTRRNHTDPLMWVRFRLRPQQAPNSKSAHVSVTQKGSSHTTRVFRIAHETANTNTGLPSSTPERGLCHYPFRQAAADEVARAAMCINMMRRCGARSKLRVSV